jgi:hydrogenase maturation protease
MTSEARPRWLVFGVGNPSRGDDALGPLLIERLEHWKTTAGELPIALALLTDFQWQVEHALDLEGVDVALFLDASVSASAPFQLRRLSPKFDATYSTHALSPDSVLAVAAQLGQKLPESWLLSIPGHNFGLGAKLSEVSRVCSDAALDYLCASLASGHILKKAESREKSRFIKN